MSNFNNKIYYMINRMLTYKNNEYYQVDDMTILSEMLKFIAKSNGAENERTINDTKCQDIISYTLELKYDKMLKALPDNLYNMLKADDGFDVLEDITRKMGNNEFEAYIEDNSYEVKKLLVDAFHETRKVHTDLFVTNYNSYSSQILTCFSNKLSEIVDKL